MTLEDRKTSSLYTKIKLVNKQREAIFNLSNNLSNITLNWNKL